MKPVILITPGDPAGIGAEVSVKAAADPAVQAACIPVMITDRDVAEDALAVTGAKISLQKIRSVEDAEDVPGTLQYIDSDYIRRGEYEYGKLSEKAGEAAFRYVTDAIALLNEKRAGAVATGPINKEAIRMAGHDFAGHTEIFAHYTDTKDYAMLLVSGNMRVIHVTTHVSMRQAADLLTKERVLKTIRLAARAMAEMGIPEPKIGVAGFNPHASEHGLFGDEEERGIIPAVEAAKAEGLSVTGPVPPDTVFVRMMAGEFDIVVAMYHDQGHIPLKLAGFRLGENANLSGINTTVGLPVIRTSVDHGTAFDRAGKNNAHEGSMVESILLAAQMANARASRVMILADDFTGAMDTAVRFAARGVRTKVISNLKEAEVAAAGCEALAVNLDTRHKSPDEARTITKDAVMRLMRLGFGRVYVKTDSGLRGNIASYLAGAQDAMHGAPPVFVPAWPGESRVLKDGVYTVAGTPVSQSAFGKDPLNPVKHDKIEEIIPGCTVSRPEEAELTKRNRVYVLEAETESDLAAAAEAIRAQNAALITAGCAGFGAHVPDLLGLPRLGGGEMPEAKGCLILSGSVAERNVAQILAGGVPVYGLKDAEAAKNALAETGFAVLTTARDQPEAAAVREQAVDADYAAQVMEDAKSALRSALSGGFSGAVAVFGGDTLRAAMEVLAAAAIRPVREIESGVVLAECETPAGRRALVTKSGNLGSPDIVEKIKALFA